MSVADVRAALETALNGMSPSVAIAWENVTYTPVVGTPFQAVSLVCAAPDNSVIGSKYAEQGFMQVELRYPVGVGPSAAQVRAQALRTTFARGASFTSGSTTVTITKTPAILPGFNDADRYVVAVRVPFTTNFG